MEQGISSFSMDNTHYFLCLIDNYAAIVPPVYPLHWFHDTSQFDFNIFGYCDSLITRKWLP